MAKNRKPRLFALLVGINTYINKEHDFKDLRGCLEDVRRMKAYLNEGFVALKYSASFIHELTEDKATKTGIIRAFEQELGKATEGDSILFYFSGHGVREQTNLKAFKEDEFDGNISSLVCHESNPKKHQDKNFAGISDKELRFLIHQLEQKTKAHIVTIFDCCHSGENTRSLHGKEKPATNSRQIERRAVGPRHDDAFYFGKKKEDIFTALKTGKNLTSILPEGKHIQLSACREVELAIEVPPDSEERHGVFTAALLDVLTQFKGEISYDDLYLRVLNRMPTYNQTNDAQTPQMYLSTHDSHARYRTFLSHEPSDKKLSCQVVLGGEEAGEKEWKATAGALQGIPLDKDKRPKVLTVKSRKDKTKTWAAEIEEVFPGYCRLFFQIQSHHLMMLRSLQSSKDSEQSP